MNKVDLSTVKTWEEEQAERYEQRKEDRRAIRDRIKRELPCTDYLQRSEGGLYICPWCGSGEGSHHTGALKYNKESNTVFCFSCMSKGERPRDVIDLVKITRGVDYNAALEICAAAVGLSLDAPQAPTRDHRESGGHIPADKKKIEYRANTSVTEVDYNPYYRECMKRITDPVAISYLQGRGISLETAKACYLGYDPKSDPAGKGYPTARIILPTSKRHYVARAIHDNPIPKMRPTGQSAGIFNEWRLKNPGTIFVLEGAFDALSVEEIGRHAAATNGANETAALCAWIEDHAPAGYTFILCRDQDEAGARWYRTISDALQAKGFSFLPARITGQFKDANEHLQHDRQAFIKAVEAAEREAAKL